MDRSFERGFLDELRGCLQKLAVAQPEGAPKADGAARPPPPKETAPPAPPSAPRPAGVGKVAGVASGLEHLYETIGPSAGAKKALEFVTPRMDAHLLGQAAAKRLAE